MTSPVVYRQPQNAPNPIIQTSELIADQGETIPYTVGTPGTANLSLAGFTSPADTAAAAASEVPTSKLEPDPWNISWVQGDDPWFQWVFTDVFWMLDDPGLTTPLYNNTPLTVSTADLTSNVATLTVGAHSYAVGYSINVTGVGAAYDGTWTISAVTGTTISYAVTHTDVASAAAAGSVELANMPVWESREWAAQVRNPYIYSTYAADYWVPAYGYQYNWWRGHSDVVTFTCTAEAVEIAGTSPTQWGTLVTITATAVDSANILPGNWYRWDMQTRKATAPMVRTHLRGRAQVITEWTVG